MPRAPGSMVKLAPPWERHPASLAVIAERLRLKGVQETTGLLPEPDAERGTAISLTGGTRPRDSRRATERSPPRQVTERHERAPLGHLGWVRRLKDFTRPTDSLGNASTAGKHEERSWAVGHAGSGRSLPSPWRAPSP
nr:hypothetical protein KitaXyl93_75080 [Kitasatospora sp. Xyl93]